MSDHEDEFHEDELHARYEQLREWQEELDERERAIDESKKELIEQQRLLRKLEEQIEIDRHANEKTRLLNDEMKGYLNESKLALQGWRRALNDRTSHLYSLFLETFGKEKMDELDWNWWGDRWRGVGGEDN